MNYNTLGFTLHRKCNAKCDMCCFSSNPHCKEELSVERIKDYIDEAENIQQIQSIAFTGGEPFLSYEKLLSLVMYATSKGKRATCVTNGFWATDYDTAYNKLKELVDAGLKHLSISHDNYHKEYVKTDNVVTLLKVATHLNLPHTVAMVKIKNEKVSKIIENLDSALYGSNIQIVPCLPAGGAKKTFEDNMFDRTLSSNGLRCIYGGNLVISYDGKIYPCCSQMITCVDLSIGNFNDLSLTEALKKIKNNSILYLLRNKSMDFFTDVLKENGISVPERVVNPCELCAFIFKKEHMKLLFPYIQNEINELKKARGQCG